MCFGTNGRIIRGHRIQGKKPERGTGLVWNVVFPLQRERLGKCCWLFLTPKCARYFFARLVHLFFFSSILVCGAMERGGIERGGCGGHSA